MGPENKIEFTGETLYIGDCANAYYQYLISMKGK